MLDRSRPFGIVHGEPGAAFEQGGRLFRSDGSPALMPGDPVELPPAEPPSQPPPEPLPPPAVVAAPEPEPDVDLDKAPAEMNDKELRVLVETYGGTWTNRKAGLKFIAGES